MSLYEHFQPSMLPFNNVDPFCMDHTTHNYSFSPPFPSADNYPDISSSMDYLETILSDEYMDFPLHVDELYANTLMDDFQMYLDEFDRVFNDDADDIPQILDEVEENGDGFHEWGDDHAMRVDEASSSMDMMSSSMHHPSLVLPFEGMEVDNQLCLLHLLKAYAEAMESQEPELSEEIAQRVIQKVGPLGGTTDRLLYYMFQHQNREVDYLTQESIKNFYLAFKAFYQIFPYGRFAHLVANLAILEALPTDAEIIHLIDFDIGEGLQWASLIEAIKHHDIEIRLTSIKFNEDDENCRFRWRFKETKRRLCDHAKSYGLKIKIDEVELQDLESMMMKIKKEDDRKNSWYVFNSHVGLPHMGRARSKKDVLEFLRLAKDFLHNVTCCGTSKGIITYGDGEALNNRTMKSPLSYSSFLDAHFVYYRALLESIESNFPDHLGEARLVLESLFVRPNACAAEWGRKWEERRQCGEVEIGQGLEGLALSEEILGEAKEVVKEGDSLYGVRIEGEKKNEMVMERNGVPMVRVCCWKSYGKHAIKQL